MNGKREIIFDTETTGLSPYEDRITEIGCIETIDCVPTGEYYHVYLNPKKPIPERVTEITGLTNKFLEDKFLFEDIAQGFVDFVGDGVLVAHNADFDKGFINQELKRCHMDPIPDDKFFDTLEMAREAYPGKRASLDALCKKFKISLEEREHHGALVDAKLLCSVYKRMKEDVSSTGFEFEVEPEVEVVWTPARKRPIPLGLLSTEKERQDHKDFIMKMDSEGFRMLWWKILQRS